MTKLIFASLLLLTLSTPAVAADGKQKAADQAVAHMKAAPVCAGHEIHKAREAGAYCRIARLGEEIATLTQTLMQQKPPIPTPMPPRSTRYNQMERARMSIDCYKKLQESRPDQCPTCLRYEYDAEFNKESIDSWQTHVTDLKALVAKIPAATAIPAK